MAIVAAFVGILVLIVAVAGVVILLSQPPAPVAPCEPGRPCAPGPSLPPVAAATLSPQVSSPPATPQPATPVPGTPAASGAPTAPPPSPSPVETPTSNAPPVVLGGSSWRSATIGYGFEFDARLFQLSQSTDNLAVLGLPFFDAQVVIQATGGDVTPAAMLERQLAVIDGFMIGRTEDTDDYDALLGPSIGYVSGEGAVYSGILTTSDGTPSAPGGVTIMTSTDGRITVAVVVIVPEPDSLFGSDTAQFIVRTAADDIVKSFDWGSAP